MLIYYFILHALFAWSCNFVQHKEQEQHRQPNIQADTTITKQTSFNNLFVDTNQVASFLSNHPAYQKFQQQYADFYKQRNYEFAWFDSSGISEQAYNFINLLGSAVNTYNDSSLYNKELVNEVDAFKKDTTDTLIHKMPDITETELALTGQFFMYASKVYNGSDIDIEELGWFIPRKKVDLSVLLDSLIENKSGVEGYRISYQR
jgi:hypothetical protein